MEIIISNASNKPIYEQITTQIKDQILTGELAEGERLPSIRALANDLRISVITTKRAYTDLENEGFIETVAGKGSFVAGGNLEFMKEEKLKRVETFLQQAIDESKGTSLSSDELVSLLKLLLEGGEHE